MTSFLPLWKVFTHTITDYVMHHPSSILLGGGMTLFFGLWLFEFIKNSRLKATLFITTKEAELKTTTKEELKSVFQSLSLEALGQNNRIFMDLAQTNLQKLQDSFSHQFTAKEKAVETLITPIRERLAYMDDTLKGLEKERIGSYQALRAQVDQLLQSQHHLCQETSSLAKALRTPHIRGRWGEIQLRRLVEISGLSSYCDFSEQVTTHNPEGRFRPDMVVSLPEGKRLVLDAKVPLTHYLEAMEILEESLRRGALQKHAQSIRTHVTLLSGKAYWQQFTAEWVPEFVVLFLPGEAFFSAALESDPQLIEWSLERRVILATPATLVALLHAIAYGWRQERLADQILELSQVGKELAKRLNDVLSHMGKVGSDLEGAVKSYNRLIGSMESRLLPGVRRFRDLSGHPDPVPTLTTVDGIPKPLSKVS